MENIIDIIKKIGYGHNRAIIVPFAGGILHETEKEFREALKGIANVEIWSNGNKQMLLIKPIIK